MESMLESVRSLVTGERALSAFKVVGIASIGYLLARVVRAALDRGLSSKVTPQIRMLVLRASFYLILGITAAMLLSELGFNLSVALGAAGVLTVAVGFASQTSVSNLISGLFLIGEQPFVVGDIIRVGDVTGELLSVGWMAVRLRTFDNLLVRIPNETMIKQTITNLSHFPIRRVDVLVGVAYKEDIGQVRKVLEDVADRNPICLEEPAPLFIFLGFGDSSLNLQFSVWGKRENYLDLLNTIRMEIKAAFDAHGIEIPFPHRTLYAGSVTDPLPVQIVGTTDKQTDPAA